MPDELAQPPMTTTLEVDDRHARLVVTGEVDLLTAPDFISALGAAQEAAPDVVVDLTEVRFMDSTGLRALLEARRRADADGAAIALHLAPGGPVERLLDLAGVLRLFDSPAGG